MQCKECGFSKRGEQHNQGPHHRNLIRKRGALGKDEKGYLEKRTEKRSKPLEIEDENTKPLEIEDENTTG